MTARPIEGCPFGPNCGICRWRPSREELLDACYPELRYLKPHARDQKGVFDHTVSIEHIQCQDDSLARARAYQGDDDA